MTLDVVQSRGLVDQVFDRLAGEILSGTYAPGQPLPSERALAESFAVNRQVVREASRRLAQLGLVQVLHGDATRVLDFRATGGLDLLALLIERQTTPKRSLSFWMPILELRAALAPDVVRHCTRRGKQALRNELLSVAMRMSETRDDDDALYELELRFWNLIHEGADHLIYRFTYNSFMRGAASFREQSRRWAAYELKNCGYRVELAKAIAAGDAEGAEREIRANMRAMLEAAEAELGRRARAASGSNGKAQAASPAKTPSPGKTATANKVVSAKPDKPKTKPRSRAAPSSSLAKPPSRKKASSS